MADEQSTAATNGPSSVVEAVLRRYPPAEAAAKLFLPGPAFDRFVRRFYPQFPTTLKRALYHAFVEGACAFAEGVAEIYEIDPLSEEKRAFARDIRRMVQESESRG